MEEAPPSNADAVMPETSLGTRMMNIFIAPTEVFDEIKNSPARMSNILGPVGLAILAGIIFSFVVFSNDQIIQSVRAPQEKAMQDMVDAKKMTQQQADQGLAMAEKFTSPAVLKTLGILGSIFGNTVMLFAIALMIWLIGSFVLKSPFEYLKALEVVGMASMIAIPERIIAMLLAIIYGNASMTPGPVLLVGHFDPQNKLHVALSMMNVFAFWSIALWAIGLSRLSGKSFLKSLFCIVILLGSIILVIVVGLYSLTQALGKLGHPGGK